MLKLVAPFKLFGYLVVLLIALAILYAGYISITYWSGIAV